MKFLIYVYEWKSNFNRLICKTMYASTQGVNLIRMDKITDD